MVQCHASSSLKNPKKIKVRCAKHLKLKAIAVRQRKTRHHRAMMNKTHIPTINIPLKYKHGVNFQHISISLPQLSASTNKSTVKRGSTIVLSHIQFLMRTVSKKHQHCSSSAAGGDKASHPSRYFRSVMCRYDTTVLPERTWRWHHSNPAMTTCHRLYRQRSHRSFHFTSVYIRDFQQ